MPAAWPVAIAYLIFGAAGLWLWQYYQSRLAPIVAMTIPDAQALILPTYLALLFLAQQMVSHSVSFFRQQLRAPQVEPDNVRQAMLRLNYQRFRVLHNVMDARSGLDFDHLVIGPTGVFVVLDPPTISVSGSPRPEVDPRKSRELALPRQERALAQVEFVENTLQKITGRHLPVTPIFCDANVSGKDKPAFIDLIEDGKTALADDEVARLDKVLRRLLVSKS